MPPVSTLFGTACLSPCNVDGFFRGISCPSRGVCRDGVHTTVALTHDVVPCSGRTIRAASVSLVLCPDKPLGSVVGLSRFKGSSLPSFKNPMVDTVQQSEALADPRELEYPPGRRRRGTPGVVGGPRV